MTGFINSRLTGDFAPLWVAMEMADAPPEVGQVLRDRGSKAMLRHDPLEAMVGAHRFLVADRPGLADGRLIASPAGSIFTAWRTASGGPAYPPCARGWWVSRR